MLTQFQIRCKMPSIDSLPDRMEPISKHSRYALRPSFRLALSSATHTGQPVTGRKLPSGRSMKAGGSGSEAQREDQTMAQEKESQVSA